MLEFGCQAATWRKPFSYESQTQFGRRTMLKPSAKLEYQHIRWFFMIFPMALMNVPTKAPVSLADDVPPSESLPGRIRFGRFVSSLWVLTVPMDCIVAWWWFQYGHGWYRSYFNSTWTKHETCQSIHQTYENLALKSWLSRDMFPIVHLFWILVLYRSNPTRPFLVGPFLQKLVAFISAICCSSRCTLSLAWGGPPGHSFIVLRGPVADWWCFNHRKQGGFKLTNLKPDLTIWNHFIKSLITLNWMGKNVENHQPHQQTSNRCPPHGLVKQSKLSPRVDVQEIKEDKGHAKAADRQTRDDHLKEKYSSFTREWSIFCEALNLQNYDRYYLNTFRHVQHILSN